MTRALRIKGQLEQTHTIEDLTEVFESIASIHIGKIRNKVVASKAFFAELWQTYRGLRVNPKERLRRTDRAKKGRNVFVAVTSEAKLSGTIDEQIIGALLAAYKKPATTDIFIIGAHGLTQLRQRGVSAAGIFHLPAGDTNIAVSDILQQLVAYDQIQVFYQTYESLRTQKIVTIELLTAVRELGENVTDQGDIVSSRDYIFEPSINEIADYMESVMMGVALTQIIMESKLASYAARFNAMHSAKQRATKLTSELRQGYYRAKRSEGDERLKETIKVMRLHSQKVIL